MDRDGRLVSKLLSIILRHSFKCNYLKILYIHFILVLLYFCSAKNVVLLLLLLVKPPVTYLTIRLGVAEGCECVDGGFGGLR